MSPDRDALPQPPWSQSPAEVEAWLASTGGRRPYPRPPPRQTRVRGFVLRCSPSEERRILHHLGRLRFVRSVGQKEPLARAWDRLARIPPTETFRGAIAGARVTVRLPEGPGRRVRIGFTPRVTERTATKIIARLGIDATEGSWL